MDAGAHHGSILARWLDIVKDRFLAILALEADRENIARLRAWVSSLPAEIVESIQARECALAAEVDIRSFSHGMDLASRIVAKADGEVRAGCLDDLDFPVTYAKLHLEGGGWMRFVVT